MHIHIIYSSLILSGPGDGRFPFLLSHTLSRELLGECLYCCTIFIAWGPRLPNELIFTLVHLLSSARVPCDICCIWKDCLDSCRKAQRTRLFHNGLKLSEDRGAFKYWSASRVWRARVWSALSAPQSGAWKQSTFKPECPLSEDYRFCRNFSMPKPLSLMLLCCGI